MSEHIVVLEQPKVNPPAFYRNPPRNAARFYQKTQRAALHCYGCGHMSRGFKCHHWKFCPMCGAEVKR